MMNDDSISMVYTPFLSPVLGAVTERLYHICSNWSNIFLFLLFFDGFCGAALCPACGKAGVLAQGVTTTIPPVFSVQVPPQTLSFVLFTMAFCNPGEQDFLGFEVGPLKTGPPVRRACFLDARNP